MTPERFRQIEQLAMRALRRDKGARVQFLDEVCSGDAELRREVESLLAADEAAGNFLAEPAPQLMANERTNRSGQNGDPAATPALPPISRVGRYIVERELGSGGMGLVYAAYDPQLGRNVAIKLVRPASSRRTDAGHSRARLLREAQAMAQLTHPNVVAIHDVGTFGDEVFIAMEYVAGSTLTEWLGAERRTRGDIVSIFAQAGRGLAAAHAKHIVHRDFKPDNVWVGDDGRARVLDFGLARPTRDTLGEERPEQPSARVSMLEARVTVPGMFLGTPPYMAPEQLRGELGDARADQFGFCVALFSALYGELPYRGDSVATLLEEMERRRVSEPPNSGHVPSWLRRVLLRGLSPDPAERYESMDMLLEALNKGPRLSRLHFLVPAALALAAIAVLLGRIDWHAGTAKSDPSAVSGITSLAVLPLKNLSGDSERDYFVDGMTEALVTELGKIGALRVLSYRSVIPYRETTKPLPEIARELNVDAFVEGAVLHFGDRVRITAKLVQASPERHLWAESYESDVSNVLAVQGEVAREVAARIRVKVTGPEHARLVSSRRVDPEAYQAYLLGRAYLSKAPTSTSWARAKEHFDKAIAKDPTYAPAYAGLAELQILHRGSATRDPREGRRKAKQLSEKALALDDTLAETHTTLARIAQQDWDWATAEREYRRAIELNPSYAPARIRYAMYLYAMLRFEESIVQAKWAQQLDPVSPMINTWAGNAYFFAGQREEAMASWRKALELDPTFSDASLLLGKAYVIERRYPEAIAELRKALSFNERQPLVLGALAHAYARAGQSERALELVSRLNRIEEEEPGYTPPFGHIWAYAGLGEKDRAFAYLERSFEERRDRMVFLQVDRLLDPLRSDPRYEDLVRRIGLPARAPPRPQ